MSESNIKSKIANHWDANTCDYRKMDTIEGLDNMRSTQYPYLEKELRLQNLTNKEIIEIGVGSAIESCTVLRNTKPKKYVLYDISPKTLELAKNHLDSHHPDANVQAINGDMENMETITDNSFDRVYALGSIHHTPDVQKAINEIFRILRPDGDFLFMFYCKDSWRYKVKYRLVAMKNPSSTQDEIVRRLDGEDNPLGKAYTKKEIKNFCKNAGLNIKQMKGHEEGFALYVYGTK